MCSKGLFRFDCTGLQSIVVSFVAVVVFASCFLKISILVQMCCIQAEMLSAPCSQECLKQGTESHLTLPLCIESASRKRDSEASSVRAYF